MDGPAAESRLPLGSVGVLPQAPHELEVLTAPFDVRLTDDTVLQPDVLVCRLADLTQRVRWWGRLLASRGLEYTTTPGLGWPWP